MMKINNSENTNSSRSRRCLDSVIERESAYYRGMNRLLHFLFYAEFFFIAPRHLNFNWEIQIYGFEVF